ncbi:MAG: rRNA pseudouridine synthase, partial [Bacteroidetes bacterium]
MTRRKQQSSFFEKKKSQPAKPESSALPMRLNKFVAHAGICARRQAA